MAPPGLGFEETMGKDTLDGVKELLGGHADPDDIASVVLFLASDDTGWVNGQALAAAQEAVSNPDRRAIDRLTAPDWRARLSV